jgi:tetratricopeptide (TPR) repeat protein
MVKLWQARATWEGSAVPAGRQKAARYNGIVKRFLIAGLLVACRLTAQDALIARAYDHFYNLEYDEAIADFDQALRAHPENPDYHNHVAEALVFREMYRDGALESELVSGNNSFLRRPKLEPGAAVRERFLGGINKAMNISQARLKTNPRDTGALYALGISYGLRSNYFFLVEKAWKKSLDDATSARKLHNKVSEIDPANVDARLVQGLHDFLVGSLPLGWRMLGFLVGFHGDKEKGIRTIQDVAAHGRINRVDAEIFLCALYRRERQPKQAIPLLDDLLRHFPRNYLLRFEQAEMYAAIGDKRNALGSVEKVTELKNGGVPGYARVPWEKIWYEMGNIQFWYRDWAPALENLRKVTSSRQELDLNTGALAWLRTGQIYDMTQRRTLAMQAYQKAIAFAPQADAARESRRYLSAPYRREKT